MKICIFGLGYIGLPTAAMFAHSGVEVLGIDVNQHAVDTINKGKIHIVENGLAELVRQETASGRLRASMTPEEADAHIIAVPTPFKDEHQPDLSFIEAAAHALAPVLTKGSTVILESTSPVGTTETLARWLQEARPDLRIAHEGDEDCDVYLAYCPERVLPGRILHELKQNDRIIGGINSISAEKARRVYGLFVAGELLLTNARTAEMSKLTENAFRDVNIAFANELSLLCDRLRINVRELIALANHHPRVNILQPGPGVGGHCIAVDPWFIVSAAPDLARMIHTARQVNDAKPDWVIAKVDAAVAELIRHGASASVRIACLGLAFKPDIDDLRESPAVVIAQKLGRKYPGQVLAVEPNITSLPASFEGQARLVPLEEALQADVVALLVDHKEFRAMRPSFGPDQRLVDTRGLWAA